MPPINTKAVTDRRPVKLLTIDELQSEVRRVASAERAGRLRRTGNWSAAQALNHLAAWMEYPYDGYPGKPPWFVRVIGKMMKKRMFTKPMPVGVRIPGVEGGTHGILEGPIDAAEARLLRAAERLEKQCPAGPNPVFGPLTHEEWKRMNLGHAELHLSFLHPE